MCNTGSSRYLFLHLWPHHSWQLVLVNHSPHNPPPSFIFLSTHSDLDHSQYVSLLNHFAYYFSTYDPFPPMKVYRAGLFFDSLWFHLWCRCVVDAQVMVDGMYSLHMAGSLGGIWKACVFGWISTSWHVSRWSQYKRRNKDSQNVRWRVILVFPSVKMSPANKSSSLGVKSHLPFKDTCYHYPVPWPSAGVGDRANISA